MRTPNSRRLAIEWLERRDAPSVSPAGAEFRVNAVTAGTQDQSAVALDADGDFVVAWSGPDANADGVFAQRYSAAGTKLGGEIAVNTFTAGTQGSPAVACSAAGDFVVIWTSGAQDGSLGGVYGQRFSAAGAALGSEFHVSQATAGNQNVPAVATDAAGNFTVVWQSFDGSGQGIFARRYDAAGTALGGEFRVNAFTTGEQREASVGMDASGDFVVAWQSADQDGSGLGIFAQRYTAGAATGGEFRVNEFTTGDQSVPAVACDTAGNFSVVWQSFNEVSAVSNFDIVVQRFSVDGSVFGINVHVAGTLAETGPAVARDGRGDTVIAWTVNGGDIRFCTLTAGNSLTAHTVVNTYTTNVQAVPALACDAEGDFVIVWNGEGTGDTSGVFGQRFAESNDAVGPRVAGVFAPGAADPVAEGERLVAPPTGLLVAFAEDLTVAGGAAGVNSVTNPANWTLTNNGVAAGIASVTYGFNAATRRFEATLNLAAPPLAAGNYLLTATDNLRDVAGNALDGDGNGTPGGAFARTFRVFAPAAVGPETPVNQFTTGSQIAPRVAADAAGNAVVVWQSNLQDGSDFGIFARRFAAGGAALGNEFQVNTFTAGRQAEAHVASDADGDFVVVWVSDGQDGDGQGVYGQRYDRFGVAQGVEFRVNQTTTSNQAAAAVSADAAGNFVVAWQSLGQDGDAAGVFARRFSAGGVPLGGEFRVNVFTASGQFEPDVAVDADGDFVIAWTSQTQVNGSDVFMRRYDADGVARGGEVQVNVVTAGTQLHPSVAADAAGNFLVAWDSTGQDGSEEGVFARRYSAAGVALTGEVAVNVTTAGEQSFPEVAVDLDGDAVIGWRSAGQDGSGYGVYARRFDAAGVATGGEFGVNSVTPGDQLSQAVAMDGDGDFVVVWSSQGVEGGSTGIRMQGYAAPPAPRVTGVNVNAGQSNATQRSRVTAVAVTFNSVVTFAGGDVAAAFNLSRIGGGAVGGFTATASVVNGVTVVTLTNFSGAETQFGSLADGRYAVLVRASRVSAGGQLLDGDGNGQGGGDFSLNGTVANGLYRLYGDVTGDGTVNAADFAPFRNAFGTSTGQAAYQAFLDANGDGVINAFDFGQFRPRFGSSVP